MLKLSHSLVVVFILLLQGCALGTIDFTDNRKIVVEPKRVEVSGDIQVWDWVQVFKLYDKVNTP